MCVTKKALLDIDIYLQIYEFNVPFHVCSKCTFVVNQDMSRIYAFRPRYFSEKLKEKNLSKEIKNCSLTPLLIKQTVMCALSFPQESRFELLVTINSLS